MVLGGVLLRVGLGEWGDGEWGMGDGGWDGMVGAWWIRGTVKGVGWLVCWVGDIAGPFW